MVTDTADKEASVFRSLPKFILLNSSIALGIALFICPGCLFSSGGLQQFMALFTLSFMISSALSYGGFWIDRWFDGRISWLSNSVKRLFLTALSFFIYSFIVSAVMLALYVIVANQAVSPLSFRFGMIVQEVFFSVSVAFIIIIVFMARSWLMQWKQSAIEAEQLKAELAESRYHALVQQLNPHFLFNSLNTLSGLVYEGADSAARFTRKLSRVYRYLLEVQYEELVELDKELKFARDYLSLQKIRFEEKMTFEITVNDTKNLFLPPLSLQLLLENVVKHNTGTTDDPLHIQISQQNDKLVVENNVRQTGYKDDEQQTGVGLLNIKNRYKLLGSYLPVIQHKSDFFRVELPLLTLDK